MYSKPRRYWIEIFHMLLVMIVIKILRSNIYANKQIELAQTCDMLHIQSNQTHCRLRRSFSSLTRRSDCKHLFPEDAKRFPNIFVRIFPWIRIRVSLQFPRNFTSRVHFVCKMYVYEGSGTLKFANAYEYLTNPLEFWCAQTDRTHRQKICWYEQISLYPVMRCAQFGSAEFFIKRR